MIVVKMFHNDGLKIRLCDYGTFQIIVIATFVWREIWQCSSAVFVSPTGGRQSQTFSNSTRSGFNNLPESESDSFMQYAEYVKDKQYT